MIKCDELRIIQPFHFFRETKLLCNSLIKVNLTEVLQNIVRGKLEKEERCTAWKNKKNARIK